MISDDQLVDHSLHLHLLLRLHLNGVKMSVAVGPYVFRRQQSLLMFSR